MVREWISYVQDGPARGFVHSVCYESPPPGAVESHRCIVQVVGKDEAEAKEKADAMVAEHNDVVDECRLLRAVAEAAERYLQECSANARRRADSPLYGLRAALAAWREAHK